MLAPPLIHIRIMTLTPGRFNRISNPMNKRTPIILLAGILVTVACSRLSIPGLQTAVPTPSAIPTSTLAPSATPQPSPTPTPPPAVRIEQGDQAMFWGDYDKAHAAYRAAFDGSNDPAQQAAALTGVGHATLHQGDAVQAVQLFRMVIDKYPGEAQANAWYFLAQTYTDQNIPAQAADAYAQFLKLRPGTLDADIQELRGDALVSAGDAAGAQIAYEAAITALGTADVSPLHIKIGKLLLAQGDAEGAVRILMDIYNTTSNDYTKAAMNLLLGQAYTKMGFPDQAYARYQESVLNYPRSYDTYSGLVTLVNDNQPVDDLNRGLVDYYAGHYGLAVEAFNRYTASKPDHDGTAHYFKGLALREQNLPEAAVAEWQALIRDHPGTKYVAAAYDEMADTWWDQFSWNHLDRYEFAVQTYLDFVKAQPNAPEAPEYLFFAARIYEINNRLDKAAETWQRLINEYPAADNSIRALLLAGVSYYRLNDLDKAMPEFQRMLVLASLPEDQAAAGLWIGKVEQKRGDSAAAKTAWEQALAKDPTGYYSERASQLLSNQAQFTTPAVYDLGYDLQQEKSLAEGWLRATFQIPANINLDNPGELAQDGRYQRGDAYWHLGEYQAARNEFESLRVEKEKDSVSTFRLMNHFLDLGIYRSAILASRQILTLAHLPDADTLNAPAYFNHIRFGVYFREQVMQSAQTENLNPLLLLSVIRQESFFEGFIQSPAGARGLMQIVPATGAQIAKTMGYPTNYTDIDLYRPIVSISLGAHYLTSQIDFLNGDLEAALAAYNGGPGFAAQWQSQAGGDPDVFLEVVRFTETRAYIMYIFENYQIYRGIYERK